MAGSTAVRVALLLVLAPLGLVPAVIPAAAQTQRAGDGVRVTEAQLHQIEIVTVQTHAFRQQQSAVGQIAYNEDASTPVLTPFSGRVTRVIAKVGDQVKRGDPLFELDSSEVVLPQNDFIAAVSGLNKARTQLELARIAEKRASDLYEGKAAALKELQQARAQLVGAENDLRSAETALEALRQRLRILGLTDEEITELENKRTIRRATPITAPIDGTVVARRLGVGQYVRNDAGDALYVISDLSTMWLKAYVPENEIPLVRVGQKIEVRVTVVPDRVFKARITHVGSAFDAATRRVVVRSEIANPEGLLKAEMFASFKIFVGEDEHAPGIPVEAVVWEGDRPGVWVQREPLFFVRRDVTVGLEQDGLLQIRGGLVPGETIAGRGAIYIDNEWRQ